MMGVPGGTPLRQFRQVLPSLYQGFAKIVFLCLNLFFAALPTSLCLSMPRQGLLLV